jgi:hypothetical protein
MKRFQMIKLPASTFRYLLQGAKSETIIEAGNSAGKALGQVSEQDVQNQADAAGGT